MIEQYSTVSRCPVVLLTLISELQLPVAMDSTLVAVVSYLGAPRPKVYQLRLQGLSSIGFSVQGFRIRFQGLGISIETTTGANLTFTAPCCRRPTRPSLIC